MKSAMTLVLLLMGAYGTNASWGTFNGESVWEQMDSGNRVVGKVTAIAVGDDIKVKVASVEPTATHQERVVKICPEYYGVSKSYFLKSEKMENIRHALREGKTVELYSKSIFDNCITTVKVTGL